MTPKQYKRESEKLANEKLKLLEHHQSRIFLQFANEIMKLNKKLATPSKNRKTK